MLSLGGERLPNTNKKKKVLGNYLHHDLGMLQLLWCFFAHLLILEYPDHHKNLISSSLYYPGPLHKISYQSVNNFLSNVVHKQTNRQTYKRYQKHNLLRKMLSLGGERLPPTKKKEKRKKKSFRPLPAPRSGYATTIMVFFCSFTHLRIPRSPQKFNQFFIVLPRTPP